MDKVEVKNKLLNKNCATCRACISQFKLGNPTTADLEHYQICDYNDNMLIEDPKNNVCNKYKKGSWIESLAK